MNMNVTTVTSSIARMIDEGQWQQVKHIIINGERTGGISHALVVDLVLVGDDVITHTQGSPNLCVG